MNKMNYPQEFCVRFWSKVIIPKDYENECWIWTASTNQKGYGHIHYINNKIRSSHKISYACYNGYMPDYSKGECILHSCDNPSCVNPNHLSIGDNAANVADRVSKGRSAVGSRARSKLTEQDVAQFLNTILAGKYSKIKDIAKDYNIGRNIIEKILKGDNWTHVTEDYDLTVLRSKIIPKNNSIKSSSILTEQLAKQIKTDLSNCIPVKQIAMNFGISPSSVYAIKSGRMWPHV